MGRTQGLPGSWGVHPIPLPRSTIPAGPAGLNLAAYPVRSPPIRQRGHQRCLFRNSITRLRYPLPTLQVVRCRTRMQGSLPAGGWPLPGGSRTHWIPSKGFRYLHSFPPSQAYPGATDFQSGEGDSRGLLINHLQRLPAPSPASPRHNHGTPNLSSSHSRHRALRRGGLITNRRDDWRPCLVPSAIHLVRRAFLPLSNAVTEKVA